VDSLPTGLAEDRHVQLTGRRPAPWVRRGVVTLFVLVVAAGLLNVFGQEPQETTAASPGVALRVDAPTKVRGGVLYQGRFQITARRRIKSLRLVLGPGWTEQSQINTIEPAATDETSNGERLDLTYGTISAGQKLTVWMQFQVNPLGAGHRDQDVEILDGPKRLATIHRQVTVFP
jgi:hypothetical protein